MGDKLVTSEIINTIDVTRRPGPHQEEDPGMAAWRERVRKHKLKVELEKYLLSNP